MLMRERVRRDSSLKTSGIGSGPRAASTWAGRGRGRGRGARGRGGVRRASTRPCASAGACPSRSASFGDLQAAPARGARPRARGRDARRSGPCRPPSWRARRSAAPGLSGIHVDRRAREVAARWPRATGSTAASWRRDARASLGLADVGRRRVGAAGVGPGRGRGGRARRGRGAARPRGLLLPRRRAHLVLPARHPRLVRPVQRRAQRRLPADGAHGPERRRPDPGQHRASRGATPRGGWCTLDLLALQPSGRRPRSRWSGSTTGKQNEATEYGSAFARAMEVVLGDARYVFVSGTASIDDHGATVHVGDFETQTRYTLEAVEALLDGAGARLARRRARPRPS